MTFFNGLLNADYTISRLAPVSDGQGGFIEAWAELATVRGRMRPAGAGEVTVAQQAEREITHVLYVAGTVEIARGDLVTGTGISVEVLGVRNPSQAGHHLEVDCRQTQIAAVTELEGS